MLWGIYVTTYVIYYEPSSHTIDPIAVTLVPDPKLVGLTVAEGDIEVEDPEHFVVRMGEELDDRLVERKKGIFFFGNEQSVFDMYFNYDCFKTDEFYTAYGALMYKVDTAIDCGADVSVIVPPPVKTRSWYGPPKRAVETALMYYRDLLLLRRKKLKHVELISGAEVAAWLYPNLGVKEASFVCLLLNLYEPMRVYADGLWALLAKLCCETCEVFSPTATEYSRRGTPEMAEFIITSMPYEVRTDADVVVVLRGDVQEMPGYVKHYIPGSDVTVYIRRSVYKKRRRIE